MRRIIEYIKERSDITADERKRLYQEYENGSASAKKRLIEYYMRTALQIAYLTSRKTGVALDELFSIALEEMILIIERFNSPKGEKYLSLYIRNNIQRSLNVYAAKLPKHASLDSVQNLGYDGERRLIEQLHNKFLIQYISECTEINDRERTIIMMYFGLSENGKYTIPEIADKYHITENNVKALYRRGVRKLAKSEL